MYVKSAGLRARLRSQIGEVLLPWCSQKVARIRAGDLPEPVSPIDELLVAGLVSRHRRSGTLEELALLHDWAWSRDAAVQYHVRHAARFQEHFIARHRDLILPPLRDALRAGGSGFTALCEIGCGSGRVLEHLAGALRDELRDFTGIDLSERQCALNRERFASAGLRFEAADACEWLLANPRPGRVYFTNGGVYEYFAERRLQDLFVRLARDQAPAIVAMIEPLADGFDLHRGGASRAFGYENTFSHDYPRLLLEAGFTLRWQAETRVDGQRWLLLVAIAGAV